jgi:capsular exopolysaccharide synthesis family protein
LKVVNDADFRISQLMREINVYETSYQKYSDSLEQARVDYALQAGNISNISVVQAATLPISPIGPRRSRYIIAGLLLGIFGSIGLAFICELMDHSLNTPEQVRENLQLSTLTSIPHTRLGHRNGDVPAKLWQSYSALGEQLLMNKNGSKKKARTIAITSCYPGEGVSTVAINISTWLAKHYNNNVLLIDANTLDPVVHHLFSTELSPGLVDILNGRCNGDSIIESSIDKLHVLSAGIEDINLSEVVKLAEFRKLLQALKKSYNYVVLDLPAVSQTNIVPLLSRMCDDAVMVVEAERSRCEVVQRIKEQFVKSQANIRGVILNKRRFYIPKWLYQTL